MSNDNTPEGVDNAEQATYVAKQYAERNMNPFAWREPLSVEYNSEDAIWEVRFLATKNPLSNFPNEQEYLAKVDSGTGKMRAFEKVDTE